MSDHSPTPWAAYDIINLRGATRMIGLQTPNGFKAIARLETGSGQSAEGNRNAILTAVNSHAQLLAEVQTLWDENHKMRRILTSARVAMGISTESGLADWSDFIAAVDAALASTRGE